MKKYYIGIGVLAGIIVILIAISFSIIGSPVKQRDIQYDERRLSDFSNIKYEIDNFYQTYKRLPETLDAVNSYNTMNQRVDPITKKPYDYHRISNISYNLCTTFSTDTTESPNQRDMKYQSRPGGMYNIDIRHKQGYACIVYTLEPYLISPTPTPFIEANTLQNGGFEQGLTHWTIESGTQVTSTSTYKYGYNAVQFPRNSVATILTSDPIQTYGMRQLDVGLWYTTASSCTQCGIIGMTFYDDANREILPDPKTSCGTYLSKQQTSAFYLPAPQPIYTEVHHVCTLPVLATQIRIKIGVVTSSPAEWTVDEVTLRPVITNATPHVTIDKLPVVTRPPILY